MLVLPSVHVSYSCGSGVASLGMGAVWGWLREIPGGAGWGCEGGEGVGQGRSEQEGGAGIGAQRGPCRPGGRGSPADQEGADCVPLQGAAI